MAREMKGEIIKTTEKYIYTREVIQYQEECWFIKTVNGYICTVYPTQEAAEAARPEAEKWYNGGAKTTGTFMKKYDKLIVKNHQYKRQ
jgi:hypothetical protein